MDVVGDTFKKLVLDNSKKDVFIRFFGPWCGYSKSMEAHWLQIADDLKEVSDVVIAQIDNQDNEVEGVNIKQTPVIKHYQKGSSRVPVELEAKGKDLNGLREWLMG